VEVVRSAVSVGPAKAYRINDLQITIHEKQSHEPPLEVFSCRKPGHVGAPTARRMPTRGGAPGMASGHYFLP
jgi:hypothetical protein